MENNNRADADAERFAEQLQHFGENLQPFTKQEVIDALSPELFEQLYQAYDRLHPELIQFRHWLNARMRETKWQEREKESEAKWSRGK